jgi:hypothetical protein
VAKTFIQTKEPELKGAFDEWLARIVCYAFSVSPQAFVAQVNRSTGETHKEMAEEEGLRPILNWAKRLIDRVLVEDFGERDVEFVFGQDERIDPSQQAQILTSYVNAGVLTRNEARIKLGQAPVEHPTGNELMVTTGAGAVPVSAAPAQNLVKDFDPNQPRDERGRWTREASGAPAESTPPVQGVQSWIADRNGADLTPGAAPAIAEGSVGAALPAALLGAPVAAELAEIALPFLTNPATVAIGAGLLIGAGAYYAYQRYHEHRDEEPSPLAHPSEPPKTPPDKPIPEGWRPAAKPRTAAPAQPPEEPRDKERDDQPENGERPQKPSFQIGASDGGPGKWVKETIKPKDAAYQEKATGTPRGLAYAVPDSEAPTGFTKFDSYEPETNTLIDAKRWEGWPPLEEEVATRSIKEQAKRQLRAAKGTNIVWRFASEEKASQLRTILDKYGFSQIAIEVLSP